MNAKRIRDVKHCFDTPEIYELYAHCMYMPTWEKFYERAKNYMADGRTGMFVYEEGDCAAGVIAFRRQPEETAEILGIAVLPDFRGRGIGSALFDYVLSSCSCRELLAETDDDAVEFYQKYGFETRAFMKNGEYRRYRCTYQKAFRENEKTQ